MDVLDMETLLRNVDQRSQRVEQILPTLATKLDLRELATKAEVRELATKAEVREEAERTRRYFDVVAERLRDDIRIIAEGQTHVAARVENLHTELKADIASLDGRVGELEAAVKSSASRSRKAKR